MYQVNFLPWRTAQLHTRYHFWRNCLFIQSVIAMAGISGVFWLWADTQQQQHAELVVLAQQKAQLEKVWQLTNKKIMKLKKMKSMQQKQQLARRHSQRYLVLLRQLPLLIPQSCWITRFEEQSGVLIFAAKSNDYAAIITFFQKLNEEQDLVNIRLGDVINNNDDNGKYHFVIRAAWQRGAQHDG